MESSPDACTSDPVQGLLQVSDKIVDILKAEGKPDKIVDHPDVPAVFLGIVEERHCPHLGDQALAAAKAGRDQEELELIDELSGLGIAALDKEADDTAIALHLLCSD